MAAPSKPFSADIVMIVQPQSASALRIGLTYRKIVPHSRVKEEIGRLAANLQAGNPQDVQISESHLDPVMPRTTGALFTLGTTSISVASGGSLLPYVQAFQRWNHIELLYQSPEDISSSPSETFTDPRLTVRQFREGGGLLRYEVEVKSHTGELPTPLFAEIKGTVPSVPEKSAPAMGTGRQSNGEPASAMPIVLLLVAGGLLGGIGAYLLIVRRDGLQRERRSARTLRH